MWSNVKASLLVVVSIFYKNLRKLTSLLTVLNDPFLSISEDFNFKFYRGACPRTPLLAHANAFALPPPPPWGNSVRHIVASSARKGFVLGTLVALRGENNFKPRTQRRILVPTGGSSQIFNEHPLLFIWKFPLV